MQFDKEFLSLQKTRNCLEHRAGIVGAPDIEDGGTQLKLSFPRMKQFYFRGEQEIEISQNERLEAGTVIMLRYETRSKVYDLGERICFTARDFSEIAFVCHLFGSELATKLPTKEAS